MATDSSPLLQSSNQSGSEMDPEFLKILERFHITQKKWNKLQVDLIKHGNQVQFNQLKQTLEDIFEMSEAIAKNHQHKFSDYALINWSGILAGTIDPKISTVIAPQLNMFAKRADSTSTVLYLILNAVSLGLAFLTNVNLGPIESAKPYLEASASPQGAFWNYYDGVMGLGLALRQWKQGEKGMAGANIFSSVQVIAATITAQIGTYAPTTLALSASTITGLMGFSFALSMAISCALELAEVEKCDKRIKSLEKELNVNEKKLENLHISFDEKAQPDVIKRYQERSILIRKSILIEKAKRDNHIRSAKSWAACAFAMTAVAVAAYVGLSAVTLGAVPIATVLIGFVAFLTGVIRKKIVSNVDYVANAQKGLTGENSLFNRLNKLIDAKPPIIDFTRAVKIDGKKDITMKLYLEELIAKDPEKATNLIYALENKKMDDFEAHLKKYRWVSSGMTTGFKIFKALEEKFQPGSEESQSPKIANGGSPRA